MVSEFKKYEALGYVFKKCKGLSDSNEYYSYLVVLKKPKENFKCNELRQGVINKYYAKFRCNGLITVAIYDLFLSEFVPFCNHAWGSRKVVYKVDEFTSPDYYEKDENIVCASGIHYFLTVHAALHYFNGSVVGYDDNGKFH